MRAGIAGAGILGRLLAWQLLQRGWQVSLFDQESLSCTSTCSFAAAGMLSPYTEVAISRPLIYQLGKESLSLWPQITNQLPTPVYFQQQGTLVMAHQYDRAELEHFIHLIDSKLAEEDRQTIHQLNREQAIQLEPDLPTSIHEYYYLQAEGQIASRELLVALQQHIIAQGGIWFERHKVTQLLDGEIQTQEKNYSFDIVFDCRGLGAKDTDADLRGVRGELMILSAPDVHFTRPMRLLHPRYCIYLVPRPQQIYMLGASEIESEDLSSISVRTTLELLSAAHSLHPGFGEARIIETVTQCRPAFSDHLPHIGVSERKMTINGLFRHGYLITPALVQQILKVVENGIQASDYPELFKKDRSEA